MADEKPLSDTEAGDRIDAAWQTLDGASGATTRADTALKTARDTLRIIAMALVAAGVKSERD